MPNDDEKQTIPETPEQTALALSIHGKLTFGIALQKARQTLQDGLREIAKLQAKAVMVDDRAVSDELRAKYDRLCELISHLHSLSTGAR